MKLKYQKQILKSQAPIIKISNGKYIALLYKDNLKIANQNLKREQLIDVGHTKDLQFSYDNTMLMTIFSKIDIIRDQSATIYNLQKNKKVYTWPPGSFGLFLQQLELSNDGKTMAVSNSANNISFADLCSLKQQQRYQIEQYLQQFKFCQTNPFLFAAATDSKVCIYDSRVSKNKLNFLQSQTNITQSSIAFPSQDRIFIGTVQGIISLWDVRMQKANEIVHLPQDPNKQYYEVQQIECFKEQNMIVTLIKERNKFVIAIYTDNGEQTWEQHIIGKDLQQTTMGVNQDTVVFISGDNIERNYQIWNFD